MGVPCQTITSRKSPLFTWCCVWEVACRSSSKRWPAKRSLWRWSPRTPSRTSRRRFKTKRASRQTSNDSSSPVIISSCLGNNIEFFTIFSGYFAADFLELHFSIILWSFSVFQSKATVYFREATGRRANPLWLQYSEGVHSASGASSPRRDADLREDADGKDDHSGGGALRYHRKRQGEDSRQRGHPSWSATAHLRR